MDKNKRVDMEEDGAIEREVEAANKAISAYATSVLGMRNNLNEHEDNLEFITNEDTEVDVTYDIASLAKVAKFYNATRTRLVVIPIPETERYG